MSRFTNDVRADLEMFQLVHSERGIAKYFYHADFKVIVLFRLSQACFRHRMTRPIAYGITALNDFLHGVWIGPKVEVGPGVFAGHPRGLVVNPSTRIGSHCSMMQQVGIGGPNVTIGDYVEINAGAKIISNARGLRRLTIGDNVIVAAGAVVVADVPSNSIVAGVPAKVVKELDPADNWVHFRERASLET
ncbi:MAG: serine O-acetyltransferase [Verrucomicrobiales bacterium]|jgi:serine O-acetyltransferase